MYYAHFYRPVQMTMLDSFRYESTPIKKHCLPPVLIIIILESMYPLLLKNEAFFLHF